MLIIEIAIGIVLAVIILSLLPEIIAGAVVLGVIAIIVIAIILVWLNLQTVAIYVAAIGAVGILYGIPFWLKAEIVKKYPSFGALIRGDAPYDQLTKQPLRITVMACFAVAVASTGLGALFGSVYAIDFIIQAINK